MFFAVYFSKVSIDMVNFDGFLEATRKIVLNAMVDFDVFGSIFPQPGTQWMRGSYFQEMNC